MMSVDEILAGLMIALHVNLRVLSSINNGGILNALVIADT